MIIYIYILLYIIYKFIWTWIWIQSLKRHLDSPSDWDQRSAAARHPWAPGRVNANSAAQTESEDHKCEQKTISWPTQNANENWRELAMNGNLTPENNILTLIQHVYYYILKSLMLLAWATTHHLLKCAQQSGEVRRCSQISNDDSSIEQQEKQRCKHDTGWWKEAWTRHGDLRIWIQDMS